MTIPESSSALVERCTSRPAATAFPKGPSRPARYPIFGPGSYTQSESYTGRGRL